MSINSSMANRVRRLEDARDRDVVVDEMVDWKKADLVAGMRKAEEFLDSMTPAQLAAWKLAGLERARAAVAAAAGKPEPARGTWAELALRMHQGMVYADGRRELRMADSSSADTSTGAARSAATVTSPPPRPTPSGDLRA